MPIKHLILALLLLSACKGPDSEQDLPLMDQQKPAQSRESSIQAHRDFMQKEIQSIKDYMADRELDLPRNGTGIHYQIDSLGGGPSPKPGDEVVYRYKISLLNGSTLYETAPGESARLRIDREEAEIGLHESLKMLRLGDKGLFILPSHRAFGVAGDQNKVPPFTALVYELEIIDIQKTKS